MENIFIKAKPIWANGLEEEKNITLGLYKKVNIPKGKVVLKVATSGFYKVYINGNFTYYGPARCAHGFYRADEIVLDLQEDCYHIAIEVVNYFVNSFYQLCQKGFIQVELSAKKNVFAATGIDAKDFKLVRLNERVRKIQRYSYQRTFAECYNLTEDFCGWRHGDFGDNISGVQTVTTEDKVVIKRNIPLNSFPVVYPNYKVGKGKVILDQKPPIYKKDRSLVNIDNKDSDGLRGFLEQELDVHLSDEVQEFSNVDFKVGRQQYNNITELQDGEFEILSLCCEKTGFITAEIESVSDAVLYFLFDEILTPSGDIDPLRMECCNVIKLTLKKGSYSFMSAEPVGFKYLKLLCTEGKVSVKDVRITQTVCPVHISNKYRSKDDDVNKILLAAEETFVQNSFDIFTDCPTRERAGWLCDSFFLGRAEYEFTGFNLIEHNFLENYMLPGGFENIDDGMLPMCYPSDSKNQRFIPNWAMWFMLEIYEYWQRTQDTEFILLYKDKIYKLLDWFRQYENSSGMLERLSGWVFVEWSKANRFVQDINYPSNMLYAKALESMGVLYNDVALIRKAEELRALIVERSFNGEFFEDNEVYVDGSLQKCGNMSETCQYYAFFTGVATPELYPELWNILVTKFGPNREESVYPNVFRSNAFIGNFLRLELLKENNLYEQLISEIKEYFLYMAETTGTLWEHIDSHASCNHGFASYVSNLIRIAEKN